MRALLALSRAIDGATEWLGRFATLFVLLTLAIGFLNVVARYVGRFVGLQLSSNLWLELQWYLNSLTFFLMFPYVLKHNINVRVDFLYAKWSPQRKAWVDLLGHLFFLIPFCILGLYVTYSPVLRSWGLLPDGTWGAWELSQEPGGLPRAPIKSWILVAFTMLLVQALSEMIKDVAIVRGTGNGEQGIEEAGPTSALDSL